MQERDADDARCSQLVCLRPTLMAQLPHQAMPSADDGLRRRSQQLLAPTMAAGVSLSSPHVLLREEVSCLRVCLRRKDCVLLHSCCCNRCCCCCCCCDGSGCESTTPVYAASLSLLLLTQTLSRARLSSHSLTQTVTRSLALSPPVPLVTDCLMIC